MTRKYTQYRSGPEPSATPEPSVLAPENRAKNMAIAMKQLHQAYGPTDARKKLLTQLGYMKAKPVKEEVISSLDELQPIFESFINEHLPASAPAGAWIDDFVHSKNPKFDGKSKKKRIQMALAAHYAKLKEEIHKPGTKVMVPHLGKLKPGKVVRYDNGNIGHTKGWPFYVVDVGEYESATIPHHKVKKIEEAQSASKYHHPNRVKKLQPRKNFRGPSGKIIKMEAYEHQYSKTAVDKEIRKDKRIGKREAALIHRLLKGHQKHDEPMPSHKWSQGIKEDVILEGKKAKKAKVEMKRKYLGKMRGTTVTGKPAHAIITDPKLGDEKK